MGKENEADLAPYEDASDIPTYEEAPAYKAGPSTHTHSHAPAQAENPLGTTLTFDPTGKSIITLPLSNDPPLYTFSKTLIHLGTFDEVDMFRPSTNTPLYAIADRFINPLHPVPSMFKDVTVARSTGIARLIGLRKTVWDFITSVPIPLDRDGNMDDKVAKGAGVGDVYRGGFLMTLGSDGIGMQKHLLRFYDGKWVDEHDEVLALAREGGPDLKGMPVLSVVKKLDRNMMDFLMAAWINTLWGEVGRRVHHHHKHVEADVS